MAATIIKRPPEDREYTISFANYPEIVAGQTIASIVAVTTDPATGLTIGTTAVNVPPTTITVNISGGTHNQAFRIEASVRTNLNKVLTNEVSMMVSHDPMGSVS